MMNSRFSDEQILAYASSFRYGDAIWNVGKWHKVDESHYKRLILEGCDNDYIVNRGVICNFDGVKWGFMKNKNSKEEYRVTTLEDYELQGGEKIVWLGLGCSFLTFGKVYEVDSDGRYRDDTGDLLIAKSSLWGVIPRYEQVKNIDSANKTNIDTNSFKDNLRVIINELQDTLESKNKDYGDSFQRSYDEFGMTAVNIRLTDKFNRFKQLANGNEAEVDESLRDTIKDIAGYMVLTLIAMDKEDKKSRDDDGNR